MIEITYHRKYHGVTVRGHAKSGEFGHDLVCAAASALVLTLAANVQDLVDSDRTDDYTIRLESGAAEVSCVPIEGMQEVSTLIFDSICYGMALLAKLYPENIRYQIVEDNSNDKT